MKQKTPQEKKTLSYTKDRLNDYGANDKASRKLIPLRKARINRAYRKKINDILQKTAQTNDAEQIESAKNKVLNVSKSSWRKTPDAPLGECVEGKLERRKVHAGNGKTARRKTREFVENLEIKLERETKGRWFAVAKNMPDIIAYGETDKVAAARLKSLAEAFFIEEFGFGKILEIMDDCVSVEVY